MKRYVICLFLLLGFVVAVSGGYALAAEKQAKQPLDEASVTAAISDAQTMVNDLTAAKDKLSPQDAGKASKLANVIKKADAQLVKAERYKGAGNLKAANAIAQEVMKMVQKARKKL
jgi:hypothetical protein